MVVCSNSWDFFHYRRGHNQRALEEAANAHRNQWPASWEGKSPFSGNKSFGDLDTAQRVSTIL